MGKLYLWLGVAGLVAFLSGGWYISSLKSDLKEVTGERNKALSDSAAYKASLDEERESAARVEQISAQYLRDLNYAKETIDDLRANVESGNTELHVNAECPEPRSVPTSGSSSSASNAASPRLTRAAENAYYTLLERHSQATAQINGLQQYILSECK